MGDIPFDVDPSMVDQHDGFTPPSFDNTAASDDEPKEDKRPPTHEELRTIRRGE